MDVVGRIYRRKLPLGDAWDEVITTGVFSGEVVIQSHLHFSECLSVPPEILDSGESFELVGFVRRDSDAAASSLDEINALHDRLDQVAAQSA